MSRIVEAFIVQKILSDSQGLNHVCTLRERLETVLKVLNIVLTDLAQNFSQRLSKNVVWSYECLLKCPEVLPIIEEMDMEKLRKVTYSQNCDETFLGFVQKLLRLNSQKNQRNSV